LAAKLVIEKLGWILAELTQIVTAGRQSGPLSGNGGVPDKLYLKLEGREYVLTKSGERKFTFGESNENELVFVAGKDGKIDFLFSELYAAKRVK
jgi:hypothetical protein